jgi:hypothetical protein
LLHCDGVNVKLSKDRVFSLPQLEFSSNEVAKHQVTQRLPVRILAPSEISNAFDEPKLGTPEVTKREAVDSPF